MGANRRDFIKIAGACAVGLATAKTADAGGILPWFKDPIKKGADALTAKRWAMVVDTTKRKGPEDWADAIAACNKVHNIPDVGTIKEEIKWIWSVPFYNAFTDLEHEYLPEEMKAKNYPVLCNHCENPPCVRVCPTQATFKRASDGIVLMDFHRCIGCRFCMAACPYGSRSFNYSDPRNYLKSTTPEFPTRVKGVVEKCNFCAERLAVGKQPACVEACKDGALAFGDLTDPGSPVRKLLDNRYAIRRKPSLGTGPGVYYLV